MKLKAAALTLAVLLGVAGFILLIVAVPETVIVIAGAVCLMAVVLIPYAIYMSFLTHLKERESHD